MGREEFRLTPGEELVVVVRWAMLRVRHVELEGLQVKCPARSLSWRDHRRVISLSLGTHPPWDIRTPRGSVRVGRGQSPGEQTGQEGRIINQTEKEGMERKEGSRECLSSRSCLSARNQGVIHST